MKYKDWKRWVKSLPWTKQWFILLILVRPIADNFYYLKDISPMLSPLYIVGALIPILIFFSVNSNSLQRKRKISVDNRILIWGILVFINITIILIYHVSLDLLGNVIQCMTPILVFYYLRRFISKKSDLIGILQTFLISILFPLILIPYNLVFNLRAFSMISESRGGGLRFAGGYADIMNFAIYIIGGMIIFSYFYLENKEVNWKKNRKSLYLICFILISIAGLYAIKHTASWGVFLMIFGLLVFALAFSRKAQPVLLVIIFGVGLLGQVIFESAIKPLLAKEVRVIEGEIPVERSFNGRAVRWKKYFLVWEKMDMFSHLFGVSLSNFEGGSDLSRAGLEDRPSDKSPIMISGGMHSDFVRVFFMTGIFGLGVYLFFLLGIFRRARFLDKPERFLVTSAVLTVVLYSLSANPLLYQPLMNLILPIFAFSALQKKQRKKLVKFYS